MAVSRRVGCLRDRMRFPRSIKHVYDVSTVLFEMFDF